MTFEEFIVAASSYAINSPNERPGQAYMNSLYFHRPDLYNQVMDAQENAVFLEVDPFYLDKNLPRFLAFIAERW